ncbi:ATP-binding protein [Tissierellaceae bacterium HCP3S3_D8]
MKKKVFLNLLLVATIAIFLTSGLLVVIFYNFHMDKARESVREYANITGNYLELSKYNSIKAIIDDDNPNMRITLIQGDGDVIFDTNKDNKDMDNHSHRPEFIEAMKNGVGESIRYSTNLGSNTYYYAILLSNGNILRIALKTNNILSVFLSTLPGIFITMLLILFISIWISSLLSSKILKPIHNITENMETLITKNQLNTIDIYDELLPFVKTLVRQSEKINSQLKDITEKAYIMNTIMSNMNEGLVLVDNDKNILSINTSSMNLLGVNNNFDYISRSFMNICRNIELNRSIDKVLKDRHSDELILNINSRYIYVSISPVFATDNLSGAIILLIDYTEKYRVELMRREFSANVSHELKTPLTSINGYAEIIQGGIATKEDDIKRFASIIREEGTRLLNLIDDIIRLSKIEESHGQGEFQPIDIYSIGKNVVDNLSLMAKDKDIALSIIGQKTIIQGNKSMIEELLYNLLDNAIKYTNANGSVELNISTENSHSIIRVTDTGIGIPIEYQDRIFERFYMVDKSRSKKTQSTGLGLSIVKHIVEYHGGNIVLKSTPGRGTEIRVEF